MNSFLRWSAAIVVTIGSFVVCTWLAGLVVLPHLMSDQSDRWVVSTSLGVAAAALGAAWGYGYAKRTNDADATSAPESDARPNRARAITVSGDLDGIASTGDNAINIQVRPEGE